MVQWKGGQETPAWDTPAENSHIIVKTIVASKSKAFTHWIQIMRGGRTVRVVVTPPALGRRRTASCLRTVVFLFLVTFVWLQLHMSSLSSSPRPDTTPENDSSQAILSMVPQVLHKFLTSRPRNTSHHFTSNTSEAHKLTIEEIKRNIQRYNAAQTVHNEDLFGPVQNDTIIIVIQIHTRLVYLRHLIVSLAQARDIEGTLIIFSHDYYDEEINDLVQSVDFTKVMQIFYPHSIQTHPHEFPGESPGDCPRDITIEQAAIRKCINALTPDLYGHYREAKFTQTKHHWWWKANRVFNQLEITRNHTGLVLFLEEDHYVAQDFLHILRLMERTARNSCPTCTILSLGTYLKTYNYFGDSKKGGGMLVMVLVDAGFQKEVLRAMKRHQTLSAAAIPPSWTFQVLPSLYQHYQKAEVTPWISSKHNMGFALNRSVWQEMWSCARYFCSYDDYNWDWSLQHVSQSCLSHKLVAMVMRGPRVFHIGECGVHHKKTNCESTGVISKVQKVLANAARHLYPSHLTLTFTSGTKKHKLRKGNGGWGDVRDHQLCLNMTLVIPTR